MVFKMFKWQFKLQVKNCYAQNLASKQASLLLILCVSLVSLSSCTVLNSWLTESGQVAREEFNPRVVLRKYEWFKDAAAELDRKRADISVMQKSLVELEKTYTGTSRANWAESDRSEQAQLTAELNGLRSSYNDLAAQYNAAMAKISFAFANVGQLPQGAIEPLPREFKQYID